MAPPTSRGVYFTLQPTGTILSATFENGKIASQETFPDGRYPRKWVDTLREMEATLDTAPGNPVDHQSDMSRSQLAIQEKATSSGPVLAEGYIGGVGESLSQTWPVSDLELEDPQWLEAIRTKSTTINGEPSVLSPSAGPLDFNLDVSSNRLGTYHHLGTSSGSLLFNPATLPENCINNLDIPWWPDAILQPENTEWQSALEVSHQIEDGADHIMNPCISRNAHPSGYKEPCCAHATSARRAPDWNSKRMTKLQNLLSALCNYPIPTVEEHNGQVDGLYNGCYIPVSLHGMSNMQFAGALSRLGNVSNTLGFIYGILSWLIFKREEERLIREERLSLVLAAKKVNRQMSDLLKHSGKAKDWASDGRKAAKIVFGTLEGHSTAVRSFALFLLGNVCSLDCMLKIAHFPVIRENFQQSFAQIVAEKAPQWEALEGKDYKIFDYVEFLRHRGPPGGIMTPDTMSVDGSQFCSPSLLEPNGLLDLANAVNNDP